MPSNAKVLKRALKKIFQDTSVAASTRLGAIIRFAQLDGLLPLESKQAPVRPSSGTTPAIAQGVDLSRLVAELEKSPDGQADETGTV